MPNTHYGISGYIYDLDGTAEINVTVKAVDNNLKQSISTNTNELGEYVLDLASLTSQWTAGETVTLIAKKGNKIAQEIFTISGDSYEKNMTLNYFDELQLIYDILKDNWSKARTDNMTPIFETVGEEKRTHDLKSNDLLFIYYINYLIDNRYLGSGYKATQGDISIDIRGMKSREHVIKVKNEVERIIDSKLATANSGYSILLPMRCLDLSDRSVGLFRFVFDVRVSKLAVARGKVTM